MKPLPFFVPDVDEAEANAVTTAITSGWLTTGPQVRQFEEAFAKHVNAKFAVALNSATAALHLALAAIDVGPGDEVIVPTMTFAATAEVVVQLGATPVLVDCRSDDLNIDVEAAVGHITSRTKAIIPVHFAGHPCDMETLLAAADRYGIAIIEDAAHAFPAAYRGRMIGSIGTATCFSFYANKTLTTGEGGMLTTNSRQLAERVRRLSLHGLSSDAWGRFGGRGSWNYNIVEPGYKYNMTDIAAAMGNVQLTKAQGLHERRRRLASIYSIAFASARHVEPLTVAEDVDHAWHLYVVKLRSDRLSIDRDRVVQLLIEAGVNPSVHYKPLHLHPYYQRQYATCESSLSIATRTYRQLMSLPLYPRLHDDDPPRIARRLVSILERHEGRSSTDRRPPVTNRPSAKLT